MCRYVNAERFLEALDLLESGACLQLEGGHVRPYKCFHSNSISMLLCMSLSLRKGLSLWILGNMWGRANIDVFRDIGAS